VFVRRKKNLKEDEDGKRKIIIKNQEKE